MAISYAGAIGSNLANTTGTTLTVLDVSGVPTVGDLVFVACARDDVANEPGTGDSLTDTAGNTYTREVSFGRSEPDTTAANSVMNVVFWSVLTNDWSGATTLTWTHPSVVARAMTARLYQPSAGSVISAYGTVAKGDSFGGPSALLASHPLPEGDLVIGVGAYNSEVSGLSSFAGDGDTNGGSWSALTTMGPTGGGAADVTVAVQHKVLTTPAVASWALTQNSLVCGGEALFSFHEMAATGIRLVGSGAAVFSGTLESQTPPLPPGVAADDLLVLVLAGRPTDTAGTNDTVTVGEQRVTIPNTPTNNLVGYELGVSVQFARAGQITKLRYKRNSLDSTTMNFNVWSNGGTLLAGPITVSGLVTGYNTITLPTPVTVTAAQTVVCSVGAGVSGNVSTGTSGTNTNTADCTVVNPSLYNATAGTFPNSTGGAVVYVEPVFVADGDAGWTRLAAPARAPAATFTYDVNVQVWYKLAVASQTAPTVMVGTSYLGGGCRWQASIAAYRGVDTYLPIDVAQSNSSSGAAVLWSPFPGVTTAHAGAAAVSVVASSEMNALGWLTSQGFRMAFGGADYDPEGGSFVQSVGLAHLVVAAPGAPSMGVWYANAGATPYWTGATFALRAISADRTALPAAVPAISGVPTPALAFTTPPSPVPATSLVRTPTPLVGPTTIGISHAAQLGTAQDKTTGTSLAVNLTPTTQPAVGDLIFVTCARDDIASDPLTGDSLSDGLGNTWTRTVTSVNATDVTAATGVVHVVFWSVLTVAWSGTTTLTWTHPSLAARAMLVNHYTPAPGYTISLYGTPSTAFATSALTALTASHPAPAGALVIACAAVEYEVTATSPFGDSDTLGGPWTTYTTAATAGGSAATNVFTLLQHKVLRVPSIQVWNATSGVGADNADALFTFHQTPTAGVALAGVGAQLSGTASSGTPLLPPGVAVGDLLVLVMAARPRDVSFVLDTTVSIPGGWSQHGSVSLQDAGASFDVSVQLWYKFAGVAEPAPTITVGAAYTSSGALWTAQLVAYRGVDPSTPFDVAPVNAGATTATSWTPAGVATVTGGAVVVSAVACATNGAAVYADPSQTFLLSMGGADYDNTGLGLGVAHKTAPAATLPTWRSAFTGQWAGATTALRAYSPDATVTPGAVAATSGVPTPVVAVPVNAAAGPVASTSLVRDPTGRARALPARVEAFSAVPAATILGAETRAAPAAVAATSLVRTPTTQVTIVAAPDPVPATSEVPTPGLVVIADDDAAAASMIGDGIMSASSVVAAGGATALMIGSSMMAAISPAKGRRPRAVVVNMAGVPLCELPDAKIGSITYNLNEPESWSLTLLQNDPAAAFLTVPFQEVQVWRGDQLLAWGPVVRWAYDQDTFVAYCRGAMWYLQRRFIGKANRHNWVYNGGFEEGLNGWSAVTNSVMLYWGMEGAQEQIPETESVLYPHVEGRRAMRARNFVNGADAWLSQAFPFTVDGAYSPEGDVFTLKGYVYLPAQVPDGQGAFENRGLYLERFSTTQLDPRPEVQEALPGAMLSLEVQFVPLDEESPVGVWTRFETELTTPPKAGEPELINVRLYAPNGQDVYWDAVASTLVEKLAFYNTDQALIVKGIIEHLQDGYYDKSNVNITTNAPLTGVIRTRVYIHSEHPPGWQSIREFNDLDDGMDYRMVYTPTQRIFTTYYPISGTLKSAYALRQWESGAQGNIATWSLSFDGEQASSSVVLLGSGTGSDREEGGAVNASGWANGVTMEEVYTAPDQTPIDSLGAMAAERLTVGRNPYNLKVQLTPPNDSTLPDPIGNLWPGDTVPVHIARHALAINDVYRVVSAVIDLETGSMSLDLNLRV